jgi:hypothetical protein
MKAVILERDTWVREGILAFFIRDAVTMDALARVVDSTNTFAVEEELDMSLWTDGITLNVSPAPWAALLPILVRLFPEYDLKDLKPLQRTSPRWRPERSWR